jgi:hypothetical protein
MEIINLEIGKTYSEIARVNEVMGNKHERKKGKRMVRKG